MTQEEPTRRPDLWLPPATFAPTTLGPAGVPPSDWRQPPAWREPPPAEPPAAEPPAGRSRPVTPAWPAARRPPTTRARLLQVKLVSTFAVIIALVVVGAVAGAVQSTTTRPAPRSSAPRPGAVPEVWSLAPAQLRPGLAGARFLGSVDGSFESSYVVAVAGEWLTTTGDQRAGSTALHAVDPTTGAVRWQRELDGVLCATEAPKTGLLCASVVTRDPATGLGTRWQLHLLDPATGRDRATRDVDGWFTAVHWSGRAFVALEQRQPAPHAVVRGFAVSDLHDLWTVDLAGRPGQEEMFSEDRIVQRPEPDRPGLALDRPRIRDVGDGLLGVWAGQRTAFVDPADGRLVMMPHCSRLVDDGARLWCNEVDGATAYSYAGRRLVRVHGPRLAFPDDDGVGVDTDRAVFLDEDGAAVSVDVSTGKVGAPFTPPGRGSAFGVVTMPQEETAGGHSYLVGEAGAMLLDDRADRVVWRNPDVKVSDVPIPRGDQVLVGAGRLTLVDLATGASRSDVRVDGLYAVEVGGRVAAVGPDGVSWWTSDGVDPRSRSSPAWSGRRESNPHHQLGKLKFYH